MKTSFSKLLFIIPFMFSTVDLISLQELQNCSLIPGQIVTDKVSLREIEVNIKVMEEEEKLFVETDIMMEVKKETTNITLHALDLEINMQCTIIMKPLTIPRCHEEDAAYKLLEIMQCPESEVINIIFNDYVRPGIYVLHIEHFTRFDKNINKIIYPYSGTGNETGWIITNMYSSNGIRRLFPSWNDPAIKINIMISVDYRKSYEVFMNIPAWRSYGNVSYQKTWFTLHSVNNQMISTYLLTFMIIPNIITNVKQYDMNFVWRRSNVNDVNEKLFEHADIIAYQVKSQFNLAMNISISKILGKLDHIVLPVYLAKSAGRQGLIAYREKDITYDKVLHSPGRRIDIALLITYEMARQLFVGIVNPDLYVEDKWMDEMFASFYSFYLLEKIWEGENMMELFVVQHLQTALDSDIYLELKPIMNNTKANSGIDGLLYPLLYHKKAFALIRMLFHLLTRERFDGIIKNYVQSRTQNFWTILQKAYPRGDNDMYKIKETMDSWFTEIHHPEMYFTRVYDNKLVQYNAKCSDKVSKFKIPFTYVTKNNIHLQSIPTADVTWYEGNHTKIITGLDSNQFLLVNIDQIGYYRVNYDIRNWLQLSAYLQSATSTPISVLNRAQIVNDAFYFTTVHKIGPELFFNIIEFLKNETEYVAWYPMFNILSYMSHYLKLPTSNQVKEEFKEVLSAFLLKTGYEGLESEKDSTMALRLLAMKWACEFGHIACRNAVVKKFTAYLHKHEPDTIPRWTNWMYCTGMMGASMTVWEQIWIRATREKDMKLLQSLSCSEDEDIILTYLNFILYTKMTGLHMEIIYRSIIKKHVGKRRVLDYLLNNTDKTLKKFPDEYSYLTLMGDIVMNIHCKLLLRKVSLFVTNNFAISYGQRFMIQNWINVRRDQIRILQEKFIMFES